MEERGWKFQVSSTGHIAREVMRRLGPYGGVQALAHPEIVKLFNGMAHGDIEIEAEARSGAFRKAYSPAISQKELLRRLNTAFHNSDIRVKNWLRMMTTEDVLRVGLRIPCEECRQYNWYHIETLGERLACRRCLRTFRFPGDDPPREWYYHAVGPFAIENYAQGSYSVALAFKALRLGGGAAFSWIPSFDLKRGEEPTRETDFAMFWRQSWYDPDPVEVIFGECKSYNRFEAKDVRWMGRLAEAFPGAVLAFCTFRDRLKADERRAIAQLARKRHRGPRGKWNWNRVLVLTGTELFGEEMPKCWAGRDGIDPKLLHRIEHNRKLSLLCDATQQIHLGMKPFEERRREESERRAGKPAVRRRGRRTVNSRTE